MKPSRSSRSRALDWPEGWADDGTKTYGETVLQFGGPATDDATDDAADDAVDDTGRPRHARGVSAEPGIYFLGLPWQSRRGSSFIWGVWHDAAYVADHIAIQRSYLAYEPTTTGAA